MKEMMLMGLGGSGDKYEHPYGDLYFGEVSVETLIDGESLAQLIGLSTGIVHNSTEPWFKFITGEGKTLYVAKKTYRYNVNWDHINDCGAVFGDTEAVIKEQRFKVRVLKGVNTNPTITGNGFDLEKTWGSEWNRLMYPLSSRSINTSQVPTFPYSGEGLMFGAWADYSITELDIANRMSWCQESVGDTSRRVGRGVHNTTYFLSYSSTFQTNQNAWRPVLELIE